MKWFKRILSNLEYNYSWLRIINSPFVKLKWKFKWCKEITAGTPYFLPRKVKNNKFVPIKYFGVGYWSLGWKTKWSDTDVRFEWSPGLSIVLFGTQIVIYPLPNCNNDALYSYWEAWIIYHYHTDRTKNVENRLIECMNLYPAKWIKYGGEKKISINYWKYILKDKYKYLIDE